MLQPATRQFSGIFINYRRDDSAGHAGRLFDRLAAHFGKDQVFMDIDYIEPGEDFVLTLDGALNSCEILLAVIGRHWLAGAGGTTRRLDNPDDFVRLEVAAALRRGVLIIPVLVQGASMPRSDELPDELRTLSRRQAVEVRDLHWNADLQRLVNTLERLLVKRAEEREKREAEAKLLAEKEAEQGRLAEEERRKAEAEEAERQRQREIEEAREREAEAERQRKAEEERQRAAAEAERLRLAEEEKRRNEEAAAKAAREQKEREAEEARQRAAEAERERAAVEAGRGGEELEEFGGQRREAEGRSGELAGREPSPASAESRTGSKRKWVRWSALAAAVVLALLTVVVLPVWRRESPPQPDPTPLPTAIPVSTPPPEQQTPTPTPTLAPTPHPEAIKLNQQAVELFNRGKYDEVIQKGTEALKLRPLLAHSYIIRGAAFSRKSLHGNAIADQTAALNLNPTAALAALAYVNRAISYTATEEYNLAVADTTKAINLGPGDSLKALAYVIRGIAHNNGGAWSLAVDDFTEAIGLNPGKAKTAYINRAIAYERMGKMNLAAADRQQAKKLK